MKEKIANGKEIMQLVAAVAVLAVVLKILFYKEAATVVVRIALTLFWLFILPGYFAMNYWREKLDFTERTVVGAALSAGIIGVASYYAGLFGLNVKYHWIMPLVIIAFSLLIQIKAKNGEQNKGNNR